MAQETIAHKTARTAFWSGIERVVNLGASFVVTLVLARLLLPEDYGVVAMLAVFVNIADRVVESGVLNALIRKPECTKIDYTTGFYFNMGLSVAIYALLFLCAPLIASFYSMPELCNVLRVYGLMIIANAFAVVQTAMLSRKLEFKKLARVRIISVFLSGLLGIFCAYLGWGAWALVTQGVSLAVLYSLIMSISNRWHPLNAFSKPTFKYLWGFGSKMMLTNIISGVYGNLYSLLIGKIYDSRTLGVFNRGQHYASVPDGVLSSIFIKNTLPIMSQLQGDEQRLVSVYRKFITLASFVSFPVAFLIAALAHSLVVCFITEKWIDSVVYLQIFGLATCITAPNSVNLNMLQVKGRSDLTLKAEIIKKTICTVVIISVISFGALYVALAGATLSVFTYIVNLYYAKKLAGISWKMQLSDMAPSMISGIVAGLCAFLIVHCRMNDWLKIFFGGISGLAAYFVMTRFIFKMEIYNQIKELIKIKR